MGQGEGGEVEEGRAAAPRDAQSVTMPPTPSPKPPPQALARSFMSCLAGQQARLARTPGNAPRPNSGGAAKPPPSLQAPSAVLTSQVGLVQRMVVHPPALLTQRRLNVWVGSFLYFLPYLPSQKRFLRAAALHVYNASSVLGRC